ncbi:hypothetical protein CFC21_036368 [Triticum aestivum]|uniref:DUF295 domain-containing protein n=2 Tax=Triticum aestivum TaxID=4565 RepID=A0A9R1JNK7_WHEAT|nr:hypothetical protein CFC21_036368 [Triticum aestivum]
MSRARAFLYLVVERCRHPLQSLYTVHRIPPWSLFFSDKDGRRRAQAAEEAASEIREGRLPPPIVTLYPSAGDLPMNFVLFGRGRDKIAATDHLGRALLYDDALRAVSALPSAEGPKHAPVSVSVGDDAFFFSSPPDDAHERPVVEALADDTYWSRRSEMHWRYVPPPPYATQRPEEGREAGAYDGAVDAYTVVGETQLWVSARGHGTYSLNTKKISYGIKGNEVRHGEWSKVGDWAMPFHGRAFFAPERRLWFGFSERDQSVLCAADLRQAGAAAGQPPVVSHEWEGFTVPCQAAVRSFLLHLGTGDGRFCVAKFSHNASGCGVAMLTGVEVARCVDGVALCLVKHKTYSYGGLLGDDDKPVCLL